MVVFAAEARADAWKIPAEGSCFPTPPLSDAQKASDAAPPLFAPGDVVDLADVGRLRSYFPPELWEKREWIFYEGMTLEIGPCHRDYGAPVFYRDVTQKFRGQPALAANGSLENHTAGLPFPPDAIDPADPEAGTKWAWNYVHRYQGAGAFFGDFRAAHLTDFDDDPIYYLGEMYQALLAGRADRSADDYRVPGVDGYFWGATGHFEKPRSARGIAWLYLRPLASHVDLSTTDDVFQYLPDARRVRRAPAVPYRSHIPIGDEIKPNGAHWKVVDVRDMLAPVNVQHAMYPADTERRFGPSGISFANDRWDLRRVLVLEATPRYPKLASFGRARVYLDLQTLQLLYNVIYQENGDAIYPSVHASRWSGDRPDYPRWPDDPERPVRVLDHVGNVTLTERGGCRIESWNTVSIPPADGVLKRELRSSFLQKRGR
jgi:hypothetical protein